MMDQIATIVGELALACEVALGAALMLAWVAVEVIGYGGLLWNVVTRQRWIVFQRPVKPARDIRWGTSVRAAGFETQRRQHA